jgi:MraZ protein
MFLSTFEKQVDAKRRIVVPLEFRALLSGPFDGIVCFPSIEADCVEGGGKALFDRYMALIEELPFGDPVRSAIELSVLGGQAKMSFDTAGRITLPEQLCDQFGLTDWVVLVGAGRPLPDLGARGVSRPIAPPSASWPVRAWPNCGPQQRAAKLGVGQ